jgi:alpha-L-rhamnosidase
VQSTEAKFPIDCNEKVNSSLLQNVGGTEMNSSDLQNTQSVNKTTVKSTLKEALFALLFFLLLIFPSPSTNAADTPRGLLVDLLENTDVVWRDGFPTQLSIDQLSDVIERVQYAEIRSARPSFSWIVPSSGPNTTQTAWQIQLANSRQAFEDVDSTAPNLLWDSGKTIDSNSTSIIYGAQEPLGSSTNYFWRVRVWDQNDQVSEWSQIKAFKTAEDCQEFGISKYPLVKEIDAPISTRTIDENTTFIDFGRAAFGQFKVEIDALQPQKTLIRLGERIRDGRVDRTPAGTTRYWEYQLDLLPGRHAYFIKTRVDKRNTSGAAFLMPDYVGEVMPFRYAEVEFLSPAEQKQESIFAADTPPKILSYQRENVIYPFNETSSYFHSDNEDLNKVWELCRYSIKATTFAGVYLDGDRERIPYEGDALLNQLSHYSVDREYSLARFSQEYMIFNPTWPTEWNLQIVQMAWYDYLYTGDSRYIMRYYDELKAKSLIALAEDNGLISTRKGKLTQEVLDSIHFKGKGFRDIVDWPHKGLAGNENAESGETDGFVFNDFNVVVNSYHYFALNSMKRFAETLGKKEDVEFFTNRIEKVKKSFQEVFFDEERGVYRDGEQTDHASLHGNMFPLAFGLVPQENIESVTAFVESRGMKCSVYGAQFLLDATYEGENGAYGLERMTATDLRGWINMIRVGSTITLEAWDDRYKPNQDWNHAWGAAPANIILRKLVGVEPIEPGFAKLRIKPQIANLNNVEAVVPTIRGAVELKISQSDTYQLEVNIPGNVRADVYIPALTSNDVVTINGQLANDRFEVVNTGSFWKIADVGSGIWQFERSVK